MNDSSVGTAATSSMSNSRTEPELPALPEHDYSGAREDYFSEATMRAYATAAVLVERERWENAMRQTWQMIDPIRPPGVPGSYARGTYQGIVDALTTLKANATIRTPPAKEPT
jgi:hypothetical protein